MRKAIAGMVAIAFLATLFLTSVPRASASGSVLTVSYTVSFTNTESCVVLSEQTTKCDFTSDQQWQGDWNGRMVFTGFLTFHDGKLVTVHGTGFFEGTILGRSGTVTVEGTNTIYWFTGLKEIDSGSLHDGTGQLVGIHGHFDTPKGFYYDPPGVIYYVVHFV